MISDLTGRKFGHLLVLSFYARRQAARVEVQFDDFGGVLVVGAAQEEQAA